MRQILVLINLVLTALAVLLTLYLLNPESEAKISINEGPVLKSTRPSGKTPAGSQKDEKKPISERQMNVVWERNLFHPERAYEEVEKGIEITDQEEVTEHFELISIAQVGESSCASIRVLSSRDQRPGANARNRRQSLRNRRRARTANRNRRAQKPQDDKNQKIYKLNDPVGETGYKLTSIGIESVILTKDEQELTLRFDKGDEGSEDRRKIALKTEEQRAAKEAARRSKEKRAARKKEQDDDEKEEEEQEEEAEKKAKVPPPPPPPPPPAGLANPPTPAERQSRRQTQRNARQQYLDRIRNRNREDSDSQ